MPSFIGRYLEFHIHMLMLLSEDPVMPIASPFFFFYVGKFRNVLRVLLVEINSCHEMAVWTFCFEKA